MKSLKLDIFHGNLGEILSGNYPDYKIGEYFNTDCSTLSWLSVIDRDAKFKIAEAISVEKFTSRDDKSSLLVIDYVNSDSRRYTDVDQALSFMRSILVIASDRKKIQETKSAIEANEKQCEQEPYSVDEIKEVIFNNPATIVFWADDEKTVVQCQNGEEFDPEKGLAMAISKKIFGNKYTYYDVFKKWVGKYKKKKFREALDKAMELIPDEIIRYGHRYVLAGDASQILKPYCDIKIDNSDKPEDSTNGNK